MPQKRKFEDLNHLNPEAYRKAAAVRRDAERRRSGRKNFPRNKTPEEWRLLRYGLTPEQYAALLEKQDGKCAICCETKDLHVDHCHETKKVRGLLCGACNRGLGLFGDAADKLRRAGQYLLQSSALL